MALELARFAAVRPYLFHITRPENLGPIAAARELACAARLFAAAGAADRVTEHRPEGPIPLTVGGRTVLVNDQRPLRPAYIDFEPGWDLPAFVAHLNGRVFFWPGTAAGPIAAGRNHAACYAALGAVVLRVPTAALLAANPGRVPAFSRCNSGAPSPRSRPNRRGAGTFVPAGEFDRPPSGVVEVTFPDAVVLPAAAERRTGPGWDQWAQLFV